MNELEAEAARLEAKAEESFQRCDTDGFLSQWSSNLMAQKLRLQSKINENNGQWEFQGLYQMEPVVRRVAAQIVVGQFGSSWLLEAEEAQRFGRKFIPVGSNSRVQKKLGLGQLPELAPARANISGRGHGLSGSAWVEAIRTGDRWGLDSELLIDGGSDE